MARAFALSVLALMTVITPAGAATRGGAAPEGRIVRVTTLADSGPGSLRDALQQPGPRIVVFDVGGVIRLASDLKLSMPFVTLAGQTAPPPGITLTGASIRVRTHDVVMQHLAIRPGSGGGALDIRDGLTIGGGKQAAYAVRVENVSVSWSVDENVDITGRETRDVTFRNSIVAEALSRAGHSDGRHSMGMLINDGARDVSVTGNLFVSNMYRNPALARGVKALVRNNLIVNPGENAIHFYGTPGSSVLAADVEGNVVLSGPDTDDGMTAVQIPADMAKQSPNARIYLADNSADGGPLTNRGSFVLAASPIAPREVARRSGMKNDILRHAGARPAFRDAVDRRIVAGVRNGMTRIIDDPSQVGGLPWPHPVSAAALTPAQPFAPSRLENLLRIEAFLCAKHLEAGGPRTPECQRNTADYGREFSRS